MDTVDRGITLKLRALSRRLWTVAPETGPVWRRRSGSVQHSHHSRFRPEKPTTVGFFVPATVTHTAVPMTPAPAPSRTLSIVIPALNEEAAIAAIVRRCLDARPALVGQAGLVAVEVVVVSDGSSDRTEAIALEFPDVTVIAFDRNRGYGAAIQCGFAHARGSLLAFIDADGTCDPLDLVGLCRALAEQGADVALGSRMGPGNEMPLVRHIGNTAFAWLLGVLSKRRVHDTASGMRVLRREAYDALLPLPHGMNFTPAMSARALLEGRLQLVEVPIAYAERVGASKLRVVSDGLRFLRSIVHAALIYRPSRLLLLAAAILGAGMAALGVLPAQAWLGARPLEDWMIYRALLAALLGAGGGLCLCAAVVSERIAAAAHGRGFAASGVTAWLARGYARPWSWIVWGLLGGAAVVLVLPGLAEFFSRGTVTLHWIRPLLALLLMVLLTAHVLAVVLLGMVDLIERQAQPAPPPRAPDRVRQANPA